ncbi:hypothetical protein NDU88_001063 [Pleurodeles waltl]|uniref:Uncharacterized protein n=1 Tax=Pleurodeles waltl TaxID=8319 RepID=A0AAV7U5B0_PLEWA|nr:hypothetical protein NDU88_001063 [Pleurodeles waltl]
MAGKRAPHLERPRDTGAASTMGGSWTVQNDSPARWIAGDQLYTGHLPEDVHTRTGNPGAGLLPGPRR